MEYSTILRLLPLGRPRHAGPGGGTGPASPRRAGPRPPLALLRTAVWHPTVPTLGAQCRGISRSADNPRTLEARPGGVSHDRLTSSARGFHEPARDRVDVVLPIRQHDDDDALVGTGRTRATATARTCRTRRGCRRRAGGQGIRPRQPIWSGSSTTRVCITCWFTSAAGRPAHMTPISPISSRARCCDVDGWPTTRRLHGSPVDAALARHADALQAGGSQPDKGSHR